MNTRQFEIACGLSNGQVNNIGDSMRKNTLDKISGLYPELNISWLQTGIGNMLVSAGPSAQETVVAYRSEKQAKQDGVPYYENIEGTCSLVPSYCDYPETPTFFINYEHFNDCTAYIPIVGDSMYPQYCSGEIIAVKRIFNIELILWGETYFVVTNENANNLRTVKQIHWSEDFGKIILRASNPNFKGDMVINKEDVVSIFIIKGKIKRNQL